MNYTLEAHRGVIKTNSLIALVVGVIAIAGSMFMLVFLQTGDVTVGVITLLMGVIFLACAHWSTVTIDPTMRTVTQETRRIMGKKSWGLTFDEIEKVVLQETSSLSGRRIVRGCSLTLKVKHIPLDETYSLARSAQSNSSAFFKKTAEKYRMVGPKTASLIGVPYEEQAPQDWKESTIVIGARRQKNKSE